MRLTCGVTYSVGSGRYHKNNDFKQIVMKSYRRVGARAYDPRMGSPSSGGDGLPAASRQNVIARQGQEVHVVVGGRNALEKAGSLFVAPGAPGRVAEEGLYARKLLRDELLHELAA